MTVNFYPEIVDYSQIRRYNKVFSHIKAKKNRFPLRNLETNKRRIFLYISIVYLGAIIPFILHPIAE